MEEKVPSSRYTALQSDLGNSPARPDPDRWGHEAAPVNAECVDEFIGGFDQVFSDPTLRDEIYDGKEQEGFVRCAMASDLWIPVTALVGPQVSEHLEVSLKHLSNRERQALVCFC
jgi:hypothetical protein